MPSVVATNGAPSRLSDVIGQVRDALGALANATPVMVGSQYLDFGAGVAPRVVFVPDPSGKAGKPLNMGNAASILHSCSVFVRAAETGDDLTRLDAAEKLADLIIDLIQTAATGRVEFGAYADKSPSKVDAYGADIAFSFIYRRDVRHDAGRWALAPAGTDTSAAEPLVPPGQVVTDVEIDVATLPQDGE